MATTHHPDMKSSNSSTTENVNCYGFPKAPSAFHSINSLMTPCSQRASVPGSRVTGTSLGSNLGLENYTQSYAPSFWHQPTLYQPYSLSSCNKAANLLDDLGNTQFPSQPAVSDLSVNPFQDQTNCSYQEKPLALPEAKQFSPLAPSILSSNEEILDVGSYSPFGSPVDSDADGVDRTNQGPCSTSSAGYSSGYHSCEGSADNSPYRSNSVDQPVSSYQLHSPVEQPLSSYQESHPSPLCLPSPAQNHATYQQSNELSYKQAPVHQSSVYLPSFNPQETAHCYNASSLDTYAQEVAPLSAISNPPSISTLPADVPSLQHIEPALSKVQTQPTVSLPNSSISTEEEVPAKKTRVKYTPEQLEILEKAFTETPYPDWDEMEELSKKLDIAEQKIKVWFQNKRARWRKKHSAQQVQEAPKLKPLPPTSALYRFPASMPTYLPNSSEGMSYPQVSSAQPPQIPFNGQGFPAQTQFRQPMLPNPMRSEHLLSRLPMSQIQNQSQPPRAHQPTRPTPTYYQQSHTMQHGASNVSRVPGPSYGNYGHMPNSFIYPYM